MNFLHYRVFADAPHGGKHVAVTRDVQERSDADMQASARDSGAPLTAFITSISGHDAHVRFFTPSKEKGESDSGALVVAHHLSLLDLAADELTVHAGGETLSVHRTPQGWGSRQPETRVRQDVNASPLLAALGLTEADVNEHQPVLACGAQRLNVVLSLRSSSVLDRLQPDFERVREFSEVTGTNGVIACTFNSARASTVDFRFFAPRRGLNEDNAGSYTLATLCAFTATRFPELFELSATQGYGMHKPSRLHARYSRQNDGATGILVSGAITPLASAAAQQLEVRA